MNLNNGWNKVSYDNLPDSDKPVLVYVKRWDCMIVARCIKSDVTGRIHWVGLYDRKRVQQYDLTYWKYSDDLEFKL